MVKIIVSLIATSALFFSAHADTTSSTFEISGRCDQRLRNSIASFAEFVCYGTQNPPVNDKPKYVIHTIDGITEYNTGNMSLVSKNGFSTVLYTVECLNKKERQIGFTFVKYVEDIENYVPKSNETVEGNCVTSGGGTMFQTQEI